MKKVIGYFPNWGTYSGAHHSFSVSMIPWEKITVVNHSFYSVDTSFKMVSIDEFADYQKQFEHSGDWTQELKGHMGEYKYYKEVHPDKQVLISIGGWTRGENFHAMALTNSGRATFIASVIAFLKKYPFIDGIDIDWEYPGVNRAKDPNDVYDRGCPGGPEDKQNFTALLREVREAYNKNGFGSKLLTIACSAGYEKLALQELNVYHQYLDFINAMTYDFHGAWETITNHHSPLYANPNDPSGTTPTDIKNKYNADAALQVYTKVYGIPKEKINVGAPFYSRGWKNVNGTTGTNGLFAQASGAPVGDLDNPQAPGGQNSFRTMKQLENTAGYVKYRDPYAKVPYLYNSALQIMLTYEDEQSVTERCDFVNSNGYGGIIIWELSNDDPQGFPLTSIVANKMLGGGGGNLPGMPVLSVDNENNAGNYTITVTIGAGNIATSLKLVENGTVVKTVNVIPSSAIQTITHSVTNKGAGTYTYSGALTNTFGTAVSRNLIVTVMGQPSSDDWVANKAYKTGDMVKYKNKAYKCLQPHTSLVGWEPENVASLWQLQ